MLVMLRTAHLRRADIDRRVLEEMIDELEEEFGRPRHVDPAVVVLSQLGEASGGVEDIAGLASTRRSKGSGARGDHAGVCAFAWTIAGWS